MSYGAGDAAHQGWLALARNQTRDYVDIAALGDHLGVAAAAQVLAEMDDYYADLNRGEEVVITHARARSGDPG